jgi:hypothetical protein
MGRGMEQLTCERRIKYSPLPSQRRFHQSEARFKGFSGPIGSGKSAALCQEAIRLSYLNAGRTGLIGAPTYPMLRDATLAALTETLGENEIPYELNRAENLLVMKDTGSKILLRSLDDFERLRGTNLAWFGVDELTYTQEGAWLRLEGRLRDPKATRYCGFAVWTPKGFDWVYRKFVKNGGAAYQTVLARPYENRHLLDKLPDFYDRLRGSYDENFFRQEVLGDYLNARGNLVYSAFNRELNLKETKVKPGAQVIWTLDFNVDPMSSVVAQKIGDEIYVLDEIVLRRATTEDACLEFEKRFGYLDQEILIYGDASGSAMQTTGSTDYDIIREFFRQRGMRMRQQIQRANPAVRERIAVVNSRLRNANGEARLFVDPKCKELIADFEQVCYREDSLQVDKEKDRMRTHLSDALGYLIWQECARKAIGEQPHRMM